MPPRGSKKVKNLANARLATRDARGIKRSCGACELPFYDLARPEINCPNCGEVFTPPAAIEIPQPPAKKAFQSGGFSTSWPPQQRPLAVKETTSQEDKSLSPAVDADASDDEVETEEVTETDDSILELDDDE